jgi:hypothetical protein
MRSSQSLDRVGIRAGGLARLNYTGSAVAAKSMQCGVSPAGRYSARNVARQLPPNASASPVAAGATK